MAVQAALLLNTLSYAPRGNIAGIAKWQLVGDTSFGGATSTTTESVSDPSKDGITRVRFRISVPKAASADSACACTGSVLATASCDVQVVIPSGFTALERQDLRKRIQSLVANAVFTAAVDNLEASW